MELSEAIGHKRKRSVIWAVASLSIGLLVGWIVTLLLPEEYTSTALVQVIPGKIPERFVPAAPPLNAPLLLSLIHISEPTRPY